MKNFALFAICYLFVIAYPSLPAQAAEDPLQLYSFAESLYEKGDYYRAIGEYQRFIHYYPEHPLKKTAELKIGYAYKKGGKFERAFQAFRTISGPEARLQAGETLYEKGNYSFALREYQKLIREFPEHKLREFAEYKIGWSYLRLEKYKQAARSFQRLTRFSSSYESAAELGREAELTSELPQKSPLRAGIMSALLPGSGQFYSGRPTDGITSFLLNGLFIWGSIESINNGNETTAAILLLFETGWYAGGIYNALNNTHKYNRKIKNNYLKKLALRYKLSLSFDPETREPNLKFSVVY